MEALAEEATEKDKKYSNLWTLLKYSVVGGLVITLSFIPWLYGGGVGTIIGSFANNVIIFFIIGWGNGKIVEYLVRRYSWLEQPGKLFVLTLVLSVLYTVLVIVLYNMVFYWILEGTTPLVFLRNFSMGGIYFTVTITLVISFFLHGLSFLTNWRKSFKEAEALKRAHLSAQYETLKNQVNPHFLFNSLNVLSNLVYKDADASALFIQQLSDVYRYVLDSQEKEVVSLTEELEALKSYAHLLKIRFGASLKIDIQIEARNGEQIIPLALQMLLENVIKHNIISKDRPLTVQICRSDNDYVEISNDLQIKTSNRPPSGIGLQNIKNRYVYLTERKVETIKTKTSFKVRIPILVFEKNKEIQQPDSVSTAVKL